MDDQFSYALTPALSQGEREKGEKMYEAAP
jgi:hypothetical protein